MKKLKYFRERDTLTDLIEIYFAQTADNPQSRVRKKLPPTIIGLALHLGFNSKDDFDQYETRGRYKKLIERARFRVMAYYESRLHCPSPAGAMFVLKSMGWHDTPKVHEATPDEKSIKVQLIETGPQPAASEKEVML